MQEAFELRFGPYRLVGPQGPLFRDRHEVKLPPKALAVLWELARQAGQVVTKAALLDAVWPTTVVGEDALGFQIQTLRQALADKPKQPRYIATIHRVGYRFIAPLAASAPPVSSSTFQVPRQQDVQGSTFNVQGFHPISNPQHLAPSLVGREAELA